MFDLLHMDGDWPNIPPQQWDESEEFQVYVEHCEEPRRRQ